VLNAVKKGGERREGGKKGGEGKGRRKLFPRNHRKTSRPQKAFKKTTE